MPAEKKYIEAFHDYEDFMMKKKQYARAIHVFHDQTAEFENDIDNISVSEMKLRQNEFLQHERDFHDVMDSFDRALHAYQKTIKKLKSLSSPVSIVVANKKYELQLADGELLVKDQ